MSNRSSDKPVDSPIWTTPATTAAPFGQLRTPDNLAELAQAAVEAKAEELERRLDPYRTPVTQETLSKQLK